MSTEATGARRELTTPELKILLLDLWEDLAALRAWATGERRPGALRPVPSWVWEAPPRQGESWQQVLHRWALLFSEELETVHAARNSVAHSLPMEDKDLKAAVNAAGRLLLYARLESPEQHGGGVRFYDPRLADALSVDTSR